MVMINSQYAVINFVSQIIHSQPTGKSSLLTGYEQSY